MYRAIITPTEKEHTIDLPKQFFGKKVEVIVVEMEGSATTENHAPPQGRKVSFDMLFQSFGMAPDFPTLEEIRSKAWPSKW